MIEIEGCPGHLRWSAFGANYMDTVCSSVLDWTEVDYEPHAELCDADNDFRPGGVSCPFCDPDGFLEYMWGQPDEYEVFWEDETPAPGVEIHFHDAEALWWSATHPDRGEERVLIRMIDWPED